MNKQETMKRRILHTVLLAVALLFSGQAMAMKLSGKVVDRDNNQPVEGAEIFLINTETQALVQSKFVKKNGDYQFKVPSQGQYDLMVRKHKYTSVRRRAILVSADTTLAPIAMELSGWEVENVKAAEGDEEGCD